MSKTGANVLLLIPAIQLIPETTSPVNHSLRSTVHTVPDAWRARVEERGQENAPGCCYCFISCCFSKVIYSSNLPNISQICFPFLSIHPFRQMNDDGFGLFVQIRLKRDYVETRTPFCAVESNKVILWVTCN